jgi:hypothetical protein
MALVLFASLAAAQQPISDCFADPSLCGVKPFQECISCASFGLDPLKGCCQQAPGAPDCYMDVGICGPMKWCQLSDRKSWNETDQSTKGRCIVYQKECEACTSTFDEVSLVLRSTIAPIHPPPPRSSSFHRTIHLLCRPSTPKSSIPSQKQCHLARY